MEQYKRILLKEFDSRQKVITELTNLEAILNLPKGTELYISDIHGEFAAFDYILRSCAGILNEKIKDCFGDSLSEAHKDRLSALVSYPELVLGEETKGQDWYLYALCLLRNDFRYFKLNRIKNLEILQTNFDDDFEEVILKKEIKYENIIRVKVRFDKKVAFRIYDELSTDIVEDDEGNLYAQIEMPSDYNLYSYIFSFGDMAEILEPIEIRVKIKEMIDKMKKIYEI